MAAETARSTETTRIVFGPPKRSSSGTSKAQPAAAPRRSKKYTRFTRSMVSAIMSETTAPESTKGTAAMKYAKAIASMDKSPARPKRKESEKTTATAFTAARMPSFRYSEPLQPAIAYENTPPAPRPNKAMEMARKAKW